MNQAPTRRLIITAGLINQLPMKNQNLVNNYKKEDKVGLMNQAPTRNHLYEKSGGLMNQASIKYLRKIFF